MKINGMRPDSKALVGDMLKPYAHTLSNPYAVTVWREPEPSVSVATLEIFPAIDPEVVKLLDRMNLAVKLANSDPARVSRMFSLSMLRMDYTSSVVSYGDETVSPTVLGVPHASLVPTNEEDPIATDHQAKLDLIGKGLHPRIIHLSEGLLKLGAVDVDVAFGA